MPFQFDHVMGSLQVFAELFVEDGFLLNDSSLQGLWDALFLPLLVCTPLQNRSRVLYVNANFKIGY